MVLVGGGHEQANEVGCDSGGWSGVSGENKHAAALKESPALDASRSCQEKCLFTTWPLWESFFYPLLNVIKLGDKII